MIEWTYAGQGVLAVELQASRRRWIGSDPLEAGLTVVAAALDSAWVRMKVGMFTRQWHR
jgi:hypothetical protein